MNCLPQRSRQSVLRAACCVLRAAYFVREGSSLRHETRNTSLLLARLWPHYIDG